MNIVENSLVLAGVDGGSRDVTIVVGESNRRVADAFHGKSFKEVDKAFGGMPPFTPFVKKIYGFKRLVNQFPLSVLARDWGGFLNGEPVVLPENELVFRSYGETVPNREMGEYMMHAFLRKHSAYLKFGKLDDNIDVHAEVVEGSPKLTYFRKQKIDPNGKVMMRCKFALRIQLKRALPNVDVGFLNTMPWINVGAGGFYSMIKAVLKDHERYHYSKSCNYIIKKAECEGESNGRFALEQAYNGGENFFKYLNYWLVANPNHPYAKSLEQHRDLSTRSNLYAWSASGNTSFWNSLVYIYNEEKVPRLIDLENCLAFVQNITVSRARELASEFSSNVHRRFYGVSINLRVNKGDLFGEKFNEARDAAVEALNMMISIYREASFYIKEKLSADWEAFTEGHKILTGGGSEIPDLDKCGAMMVAQAISVDPQMFLDGKGSFAAFAHHRMVGEFYNG